MIKLLKDNNLKITPQRISILSYLEHHRTHPTADDIYKALKQKTPSLSKTTVYNALETLKQHNLIHSLTISGSEARYDIKQELHHHFYCTYCKKIFDIDLCCPNIEQVTQQGYHIDEVHGYFRGLCPLCQRKREQP
ncbi:MAG: Fur family transcriptional regulator [Candidatus Thermoplasmatota archaeon]